MPSRAVIEASTPRCDRLKGPLSARGPCGKPMRWTTLTSATDGVWVCSAHGPMLSGVDAAMRAGYVAVARVEPTNESEAA